jgi:peptidyl-prolyl cis-trans isomerase B (cyclophilin B)
MNVQLNTSMGTVMIKLHREKAPETVDNFLKYVQDGHYDGTIFHRVIQGFMIQGGGFDAEMSQKSTQAPIRNEANNGLSNAAYTVAMARTMEPHSASSQFFINVADNDFLNFRSEDSQGWGYCVFGEVTEGRDVVDRIKAVPTSRYGGHDDVPKETVMIESAVVVEGGASAP